MKPKKFPAKNYLNNNSILISVFTTGACVLVIEVLASRILSPFFGNTIYSVSSILGVVLAALSVGYYYGGIYSDKYPREDIFYSIIFTSGLTVLFIRLLQVFLLPTISGLTDITWGPLVSSVFLFALPAFLLGLLSPWAIKLQSIKHKEYGVGRNSGTVFLISTLGSIFGSFFTGFYLIPTFGISKIIIATGIVLLFLGLTGIIFIKKKLPLGKLYLLSSVFITLALYSSEQPLYDIVYSEDGLYEKLYVVDGEFDGKELRFLLQGRSAASGMDLNNREDLAIPYTRFVKFYELIDLPLNETLFIGGGAYSMPKYILQKEPYTVVDVSEIEPHLYSIAQKYFELKPASNINNYLVDGRRFLEKNEKKYDIIFSDVYSSVYSIPVQFTTKEYFALVKNNLSDKGISIMNIISDLEPDKPSVLLSEVKTFREVFDKFLVFKVGSKDGKGANNYIVIGFNNIDNDNFESLVSDLKSRKLSINPDDELLDTDKINFDKQLVLTDDYAPVEKMSSELLKRSE